MNRWTSTKLLALLLFCVGSVSAQEAILKSEITDNWFVGVSTGLNTKTTHNDDLLGNVNGSAGLRVGRQLTPAVGFMVEGTAFFGDLKFGSSHNAVKAVNVDLLATLNVSNLISRYRGTPRLFEVKAVGGLGVNHISGLKTNNNDDLIAKFGIDVGRYLGSSKAFFVYIEPAINYNLDHYSRTQFNINYSALQLNAGVVYRFRNSNGTHHFRQISVSGQTGTYGFNGNSVPSLPTAVSVPSTATAGHFPEIQFPAGSDIPDVSEYSKLDAVASFLAQNPTRRVAICGSRRQARSVRALLVSHYGIPAKRLPLQVNPYGSSVSFMAI